MEKGSFSTTATAMPGATAPHSISLFRYRTKSASMPVTANRDRSTGASRPPRANCSAACRVRFAARSAGVSAGKARTFVIVPPSGASSAAVNSTGQVA